MNHPRLLAETMAGRLSDNALRHLRDGRVMRIPELTGSAEELRSLLMGKGLPVYEEVIDLEMRAGGAAFPKSNVLGAFAMLQACPDLSTTDLPSMEDSPLFPIYGDPEHLAEWESPFGVLSKAGGIAIFDAPYAPVPAFTNLEHFLEYLAFAPLSRTLHILRVDAYCGETLAGLLGANEHPEIAGNFTLGWVGDDVWVQELKIGPGDDWSSQRGTLVATEQPDMLVELIPLLLEQGYALGHRGPVKALPAGEAEVLSFVDSNPELGYRAKSKVQVWGRAGQYSFSHQELPWNFREE